MRATAARGASIECMSMFVVLHARTRGRPVHVLGHENVVVTGLV